MQRVWVRPVSAARRSAACAALVVAALAGTAVAKADTGRRSAGHAYVLPTAGRETAERQRMYDALRRYVERREIPAFARKYGMKCSACHLAVPVLNQFGQAFKDNGYRMKNGTDDLRTNEPAYWPLFAWLWKDYEVDVQRVGGQTVQERGGVSDGAVVFGGLGSIGDKVSFRFVPIIYEDGNTIVDHGWIRYNQAFGSDWANIKVGAADFDLPISPGREYNMGASRFATLYAYAVPGSVSRFSVLLGAPGLEIMGHDLGSRNRYSVNLFNAGGAPRAHCVLCSPGIFGRVTHRQEFATGLLRAVRAGVWGAYATWPVGPDTSVLKGQQRLGGDVELWLGSDVLPLRATVMGIAGRDDRALVPGATQDPTFNAGMLQLEYVPKLPLVFYGRLQVIRNQRQAIAATPGDFGDQDFQLVGIRHAIDLNSRFAWLVELTYWRWTIKHVAPGGANVTNHTVWLGTHLDF